MTHGLDGFSMAMDFRVTDERRSRMTRLAYEMDEIVLAAGGRFYLAKDSTLRPSVAEAYLGRGNHRSVQRPKSALRSARHPADGSLAAHLRRLLGNCVFSKARR